MSQFPSHRHSGLSMRELGFSCSFMCIHPILSCAFRLLGHHASVCVIGGTRIAECIPLCKYIAMPLSCSLLQQNEESAPFGVWHAFQEKVSTEANLGMPVEFLARQSRHAASIRSKSVPGLHASFICFLS